MSDQFEGSTNIVIPVKNRYELTVQCVNSLLKTIDPDNCFVTLIDDESHTVISRFLASVARNNSNVQTIKVQKSRHVVGLVKNLGIAAAELYWGKTDWVYFSDNDMYFTQGWLQKMQRTLKVWYPKFQVIGGYRHPYHQPKQEFDLGRLANGHKLQEVDAVGGYSMFMRRKTWEEYGPFEDHAKGVGQSEDYAFSRKIVEAGSRVGYLSPSVVVNCGVIDSEFKPAVGSEAFERVDGLIYNDKKEGEYQW